MHHLGFLVAHDLLLVAKILFPFAFTGWEPRKQHLGGHIS